MGLCVRLRDLRQAQRQHIGQHLGAAGVSMHFAQGLQVRRYVQRQLKGVFFSTQAHSTSGFFLHGMDLKV